MKKPSVSNPLLAPLHLYQKAGDARRLVRKICARMILRIWVSRILVLYPRP
jgi:hypothetical protein